MKKVTVLFLISCMLLSILCGCAAGRNGVSGVYDENESSEPADISETSEVQEHPDLLKAVEDAELVYEWFYGLTCPPYAQNGSSIALDGIEYEKIHIEGVNNRDDLYDYLLTFFDEVIAIELMTRKVDDMPLFRDIDDLGGTDSKLYCIGGYVGQKFFTMRERTVEIKEKTDERILFTLTILATHDNDSKTFTVQQDYCYEKKADGNWVFTYFILPYHLVSYRYNDISDTSNA